MQAPSDQASDASHVSGSGPTAGGATPGGLRTGWTTGACATAAAKAAAIRLIEGAFPPEVTITLPKGGRATFHLAHATAGKGWAEAAVEKDAGDDPDVTHGALIVARVTPMPDGSGITFCAGEGVGTVTKPGLPIPPGEPAINPVPRAMISRALAEVMGADPDAEVTISVPHGAELAARTWNPRLGIVGGLSILGTTGIVRPFSCAAWIASIHRGIDVAVATGATHVVGTTGSSSERAVRDIYPEFPETAFLDMGDFVGGLLKYLRRHPVPRVTIAGGIGKMTKLAQGAVDLHSKRSQVDFAQLASLANDDPRVVGANSALEALELVGAPLAQAVAEAAAARVEALLAPSEVSVETIVTDRSGKIHGRRGFAR
ncbi:cobalt-precorrin-5B (C(1))-methyltransferase [Limibaculum sp. M0105]|uniref:Cobalt-precorrin-5B C(1)-methyltransferase n=1 Tax=Thermohalobaculum xanthum TaxID=2753746 RepID=A0A8J7M3R3_9RHOB|nr:cobalt-precorrin-5B (C(1))-methyltransferase [Thermohalobaculum xanthum]MBK0397669.1 cobalt-precorrin-5B (C(1))-methyltransferase [Thermohalobaculum xanthum]